MMKRFSHLGPEGKAWGRRAHLRPTTKGDPVRRHLSLLCGLLPLVATAAVVSCSSSTPTATDSGATTTGTMAAAPTATAARVPVVTKPATVEKVDKSKLPAKAQNAKYGSAISTDEQDCINAVVYQSALDDPTLADDAGRLAGVTGASMVVCVSQDKIAELLTEDLKGKATGDQIACLKREITGADAQSLATFLGALVLQEPTIVAAVSKALDASCGTSLATT
jgi:hypothetical protein